MQGSSCKYSHEDPKNGSVPTGKLKGKDPPPTGKGGPIAKAMVALVAAASLCKPMAGSGPEFSVEWAADTVAGRHLGSHQASSEQGIPSSAFQSCPVRRITPLPLALVVVRNLAFKRFHELQHAGGKSLLPRVMPYRSKHWP